MLCLEISSKFGSCKISFTNRSTQQTGTKPKLLATGKKRFHCEVCSYSCDGRANMEKHKRVHTKEKPFKCPACSKCFSQKGNLKIHMLTHIEHSNVSGIRSSMKKFGYPT